MASVGTISQVSKTPFQGVGYLSKGQNIAIFIPRQRFVLSPEAEGWQITQTEALIIPHILRELSSIIVLLFFENILNSV